MRKLAAVVAMAVLVLLTGCAASGISEFDREQRAADKLDLPSRYDDVQVDSDSTRWLAERDGVDFYAAQSADGTCLILVKGGDVDGSLAGCGSGEVGVSGLGFPTVHLYVDGPPPAPTESMIELTSHLYVFE
ncbi:hypothetical protein [Homoserinimonas aerilata]|uniref:hypothetical protein n=1 Tax=Homoserinimonas aerilata TaxID=1162970 RepID=UPI0011501627|nr:hypothetical protein [Homoserinimonas aerilata]